MTLWGNVSPLRHVSVFFSVIWQKKVLEQSGNGTSFAFAKMHLESLDLRPTGMQNWAT